MKTVHKIIIGDCRSMTKIANEAVHLVVTAPPRWQMKSAQQNSNIGNLKSYEAYINNLNLVWKECFRILHQGCKLCINIDDQSTRTEIFGRYKLLPIHTEIIKFCEAIGFDYKGAVIWRKASGSKKIIGWVMGSYPHPRNGVLKLNYEYILIFKKRGEPPVISNETKEQSKLTKEEWNKFFSSSWYLSGIKGDKHPEGFPDEIPKRLIKMFSFVGETVFDPFLNNGAASFAARKFNRNSIGYIPNEKSLPYIRNKIGITQNQIFQDDIIEIITQKEEINHNDKIKLLPYIFRDPFKFTSVSSETKQHLRKKGRKYTSVKKIISVDKVALDDGRQIKLIGIVTISDKAEQALQFLNDTLIGKEIYIIYDENVENSENYEHGYLFLRNRTFLNSLLIKKGLAEVDTSYSYKYKSKFMDQWAKANKE